MNSNVGSVVSQEAPSGCRWGNPAGRLRLNEAAPRIRESRLAGAGRRTLAKVARTPEGELKNEASAHAYSRLTSHPTSSVRKGYAYQQNPQGSGTLNTSYPERGED